MLGPDQRLGVSVVVVEVFLNRLNQVSDAALQALVGDLAEPAFHDVEPRTAGRDKVQMKTKMFLQPLADAGVLVSRIIVEDQMQVQVRRRFGIDLLQELQPFLMTMTQLAFADVDGG